MATPVLKTSLRVKSFLYDLNGNLLMEAVSRLQKANTELTREGWQNLRISVDVEHDYGDSVEAIVYILGDRMETMEEAILREGNEKQRQRYLEQRERQQYEALKAKFG